jgi:cytochrome c-type biogenesis protein
VGLLSFASPCCLPLVPGYITYIAGLAGADAATAEAGAPQAASSSIGPGATLTLPRPVASRRRLLLASILFVAGFSAVFVSFGALFGGLGRVLLDWAPALTRVAGVVTIVMGLAFLGVVPWLQRERRLHYRPAAGLAGAPVLGVVFGLGWTPCLGPTLAAVNTLAYSQASAGRGAVLGLAYCLGLGIPFVLVALGARRALRFSAFARRQARNVMRVGGALLIVLGVLLVTGLWDSLMIYLRAWLATTGFGTSVV